MNTRIRNVHQVFTTTFALLLLCRVCVASPPRTTEEFSAALRRAFNAHDPGQILGLTWSQGASDTDMGDWTLKTQRILQHLTEVENITFDASEANSHPTVINGERIEPTYKPSGSVVITCKAADGKPARPVMPYAVIDGVYYLVMQKTSKVEWQGQPDKPFSVLVLGREFDKVKVHTKYNASGADQEIDGNCGFSAQYISEVTVTSDDAFANVTLQILQGSELIYQSKPLRGRGKVVYKNGDTSR